jgi:pimeloyl-ACP methyl ester carboxylesterase
MRTITAKDGARIFYKDWGKGQPIVFSHGWPLLSDAWDNQMLFFGQHGYRVVAHDRRSHGRSDQTWEGNNMDQYARPRSREMKKTFCRLLVERLATRCGISPDDVIVNFVTNADEDWSFGAGRAQFMTGELSTGLQAKARIGSPALT